MRISSSRNIIKNALHKRYVIIMEIKHLASNMLFWWWKYFFFSMRFFNMQQISFHSMNTKRLQYKIILCWTLPLLLFIHLIIFYSTLSVIAIFFSVNQLVWWKLSKFSQYYMIQIIIEWWICTNQIDDSWKQ